MLRDRFGSLADVADALPNVRFNPGSVHNRASWACPLSDIQYLAYSGAATPAASRLIASSLPAGGVTAQLWLNIDGYLRGRPICRRPRNHLRS